jgi:hypothetical protein
MFLPSSTFHTNVFTCQYFSPRMKAAKSFTHI